jgi:hypothetical protein
MNVTRRRSYEALDLCSLFVTAKETTMSAVLLAMFDQYEIAERVRVDLVRDGFPTDRIELTASCEPGRAGLEPADSLHDRFVQYFRVLFTFDHERHHAEQLANSLDNGAATITVHPRGSVETARAKQILLTARAVKLISHDLASQTTESTTARIMRRWTIAAAVLCLWFAASLVSKQEFRGGSPSELGLAQTEVTVPDETELPFAGQASSQYLSSVTTHYFDAQLAGLHLQRPANGFTRADDHDPDWWPWKNSTTADVLSCLGVVFCSSYDTGRDQLPTTDDLKASQQRWRDLTDLVLGATPISTGL